MRLVNTYNILYIITQAVVLAACAEKIIKKISFFYPIVLIYCVLFCSVQIGSVERCLFNLINIMLFLSLFVVTIERATLSFIFLFD